MTERHNIKGWLLPALLFCVSGCSTIPDTIRELPDPLLVVELADTPFFPQEEYQCGPAALATVLAASGVDVRPHELTDKVFIPGREGSLQVELLAATRTSGRLPYILDKSLTAIIDEVQAGRPVVVLQNLGVALIPRWHYGVVVGYDGDERAVVLRSGSEERRLTPVDLFLRTWSRSNYWAITTLTPGELPTNVDRQRYLASVADLEEVGRLADAVPAWQAALDRWPDEAVAQFGIANTLLALDEAAAAEAHYRNLLAARPGLTVARNNLAIALNRQGRARDALLEIDAALAETSDPVLVAELTDSRKSIQESVDLRTPETSSP